MTDFLHPEFHSLLTQGKLEKIGNGGSQYIVRNPGRADGVRRNNTVCPGLQKPFACTGRACAREYVQFFIQVARGKDDKYVFRILVDHRYQTFGTVNPCRNEIVLIRGISRKMQKILFPKFCKRRFVRLDNYDRDLMFVEFP